MSDEKEEKGSGGGLQNSLLLRVLEQQTTISSDVSSIKVNLAEHMRRTHQLEVEIKYLHKQINMAHGGVALIGLIGIILGILTKITN